MRPEAKFYTFEGGRQLETLTSFFRKKNPPPWFLEKYRSEIIPLNLEKLI